MTLTVYHTSNKFAAFPLVKMTSRDCPIFYYIGSATKNIGLVKFKMASFINIKKLIFIDFLYTKYAIFLLF